METTFITIHDLSEDALILYSSDSIVDILGHTPDEVVGRSSWEFFRQEQVPTAQAVHARGIQLDKAAVLAYCDIVNRDGLWVNCECCFTIVYDVMVCCTSIYRPGVATQARKEHTDNIKKIFSSSPKDPRYHMLTHISAKFTRELTASKTGELELHEPRAALFLNRFTRTLTIMHATNAIEKIVGIPSHEMKGRSFYYCIQENCLEDAVHCLESAKGNDSIAYLRFMFRDPRQDDPQHFDTSASEADTDQEMTDVSASEVGSDGATPSPETPHGGGQSSSRDASGSKSAGSGQSVSTNGKVHGSGSDNLSPAKTSNVNGTYANSEASSLENHPPQPIMLEAVVSCTSDGLVVCIRRAAPMLPDPAQPKILNPANSRGMFAAPWAAEPMFVPALQGRMSYPYGVTAPEHYTNVGQPPQVKAQSGPPEDIFMKSIREQAVFAWALTGINGSLEQYSRGKSKGESQPPDGFPIWSPDGELRRESTLPDGNSGYGSGSGNGHDLHKS